MQSMKMTELGEEEYLGYRCKKYRVTDTENAINITYLMHGNLLMCSECEAMGIPTSTYITKIELSSPPKDMFEVPKDFEITDTIK